MNRRLKQPATGQLRILPKAQMPRSPSESVIKANILKALSKLPYCLFVNTPSGRLQVNGGWFHAGCKGWPDISGLVQQIKHGGLPTHHFDGKISWKYTYCEAVPVLLEVKTDTGKLSGDQMAMHERLRALGAKVAVVRSVREAVDFVMKVRSG
jgi:hypothetical protein